eukprot:17557_2
MAGRWNVVWMERSTCAEDPGGCWCMHLLWQCGSRAQKIQRSFRKRKTGRPSILGSTVSAGQTMSASDNSVASLQRTIEEQKEKIRLLEKALSEDASKSVLSQVMSQAEELRNLIHTA